MLVKKVISAAVAAAALSVPLAGAAFADPASPTPGPSDNGNGVGPGGVPAAIGGAENPTPFGSLVSDAAKSAPGAIAGFKPGQVLTGSGFVPANGGNPNQP